jgi:hypothetical protein
VSFTIIFLLFPHLSKAEVDVFFLRFEDQIDGFGALCMIYVGNDLP